jgi:predicted DsbA family dithiol-disulfide isomerase
LDYLSELISKYPDVEIIWKPIEAHPKHEEPDHRPYVNLAVQACLYVKDTKGDELAFINSVYKAQYEDGLSIEDISTLVKCAADVGVADTVALETALKNEKYKTAMLEANDYAYEQKGVWAVPTFVYGDIRLDSVGGVGITKEQLDEFLTKCCA